MVTAIGEAFKQARDRGPEYPVYHHLILPRFRSGRLALVKWLRKNDKEYHPGVWFEGTKHATAIGLKTFDDLVELVEKQEDGFKWESWQLV